MAELKIEILCKAENRVVGKLDIEEGAMLDASAIREAERVGVGMPPIGLIMDGVQMTCAKCYEPLWLRGETGEPMPACPGTSAAASEFVHRETRAPVGSGPVSEVEAELDAEIIAEAEARKKRGH